MIHRPAHLLVVLVLVVVSGCFPDPKLLDQLNDLKSEPDIAGQEVVSADVDATTGETSGAEVTSECESPSECHATSNPCWVATCIDGRCGFANRDSGTCDDSNLCTVDDTCVAGQCLGSVKACDTPGVCQSDGTCEPTTGLCVYPTENNGTTCDDGDRCTAGDACLDGACKPTRAKNDAFSDWVQLLPSTASAQLAALRTTATGFVALVNFQRIGDTEARIGGGGSGQSVSLPEGAIEGVALLEFAMNGTQLRAVLVGTSADSFRGVDLTVLDGDALMVTGSVAGTAKVDADITLVSKPNEFASFGLRFQSFQLNAEYWLIEAKTQQGIGGLNGVFGAGADCVAVTHLQAGRTATLTNQSGLVTQVDAPETAFSAVWIVWLPGCRSIAGAERLLTSQGDGGVGLVAISRDLDGGVSLSGVMDSGLVLGAPDATGDVIFPAAGMRGFALRLDPTRQVTERLLLKEDGEGSVPFVKAVAHTEDGLWASFDVGRSASIGIDEDSLVAVPGNPTVGGDFQGRAVVAQMRADGTATVNVAAFAEYSGKESSIVGVVAATPSGRLVTAPTVVGHGSIDTTAAAMFGLRSILNGVEIWKAQFLEPVADPATFDIAGPVQIALVPLSEGVIAGGTVSGTGKIGPPTRTRIPFTTAEDVDAVYFMRLNSDDGYGCPTTR